MNNKRYNTNKYNNSLITGYRINMENNTGILGGIEIDNNYYPKRTKIDEVVYASHMGEEYGDLWKLYAALYPEQWREELKNMLAEIDSRKHIANKRGGNRYADI